MRRADLFRTRKTTQLVRTQPTKIPTVAAPPNMDQFVASPKTCLMKVSFLDKDMSSTKKKCLVISVEFVNLIYMCLTYITKIVY